VKRSHLKSGLVGALVCPLSGLLPALLIGLLFPLDGVHFAVLVLFAALPPAVLNFLFAEQYHQDPELMASLVLVGNAMSVCVIGVVLWWII
jgi:predicted permease